MFSTRTPPAGHLVMPKSTDQRALALGCARPNGSLAALVFAHDKAFFVVKAVDVVDARKLAFALQKDEQAPIAETAPFVRQIAQSHLRLCLRWMARLVVDCPAICPDDGAGPALALLEPPA